MVQVPILVSALQYPVLLNYTHSTSEHLFVFCMKAGGASAKYLFWNHGPYPVSTIFHPQHLRTLEFSVKAGGGSAKYWF